MKKRICAAAFMGAVAIVAATACQSSTSQESATTTTGHSAMTGPASSAPSASPAPAGSTITIADFKYSELTVAPGAEITVANNDSAEHTVTSDTAGQFDVEIAGNGKATFTAPTQPGTYTYHCTYHPNMHGTLIVK